ncbi:MAG: topoisomerase C-terminal repeat-containing protein, partial [Gammaproteobacteria bacterium]
TALLQGFVSKRTGRPFSAHLTLTEEGKLGFEFAAPKGAKAAPKGAAKAGAKSDSKPAVKTAPASTQTPAKPAPKNVAAAEKALRDKESVGACPKCAAPVRDAGNMFLCERKPSEACDFSLSRRLLLREMQAEEIKMLLAEGKTELLEGFVSKKSGRAFSAYLTLTGKGKLGFEFAEKGAPKTDSKPARKSAKKPAKKAGAKSARKPARKPAKKTAASDG